MRLNRALAVLLIAAAVSGLPIVAADADEPALSFSETLDTSQAGHVKGTITTEAAFVYARLSPGVPATKYAVTDGQVSFDLETWGYYSPFNPNEYVQAVACTGGTFQAPTGCGTEPVLSSAFVPHDLVPTVTWPADTTIGRNSDGTPQQTSVTVTDPDGGGDLSVGWSYWDPEIGDQDQVFPVVPPATITPALHDGVGTLRIHRCATASPYQCTAYVAQDSPEITVARGPMQAHVTSATEITSVAPDSTATVSLDRSGDYALDWWLEQDGVALPSTGGHQTGTTGEDGTITITVPGSGITTEGDITIAGQVAIDDPDFGPYSAALQMWTTFVVDRSGPAIEDLTVSRSSIHPLAIAALSTYQTVTISLKDTEQLDYHDQIEIRDATGATMRRLEPDFASALLGTATWDGRKTDGALVPAGTYTVAGIDSLGNASAIIRTVTVSHATGVLRTYRRTLSAAATKIDKYVGRCSTLRRPSLRGWSGSLGYYSNTRCRGSDDASTVSTLNALRLPGLPAVRYVDTRVDTTGGAARRAPRSRGVIRLWVGDRWTSFSSVSRTLGTHAGPRGAGAVDRDRYVVWNFGTAIGHKYDVKSFTVTVRYYSWS
ncbi:MULTISPECIES: hypothetical protein [unclassified Nocardioides]|uniref:hypothetical protein n=1 Tax=unclassified Nocardioides TaxID=2615069 RepID=UPI0007013433|nr:MULTISPECIES: hypothetical protein [unclassified Nocardioides]KRA38438.1 hypothetical protein ASD81_07350 [Nocardioides sp. Root614]KRA92397.1 hypothetical protein ASD84_07615 [Nocardioides sp. Root682]